MSLIRRGMSEAVRRNHAIEHATIAVLLGRLQKRTRIIGRATQDGFYIYGDIPEQHIEDSAREALARLQRGESHLAVSPLCGTNIVVTAVATAIVSAIAIGGGNRMLKLPNAILATLAAVVASRPLGSLIQKYVTTSPEVDGMQIISVQPLREWTPNLHKVTTAP